MKAINFISLKKEEGYKRARFVDLQEFFKNYQKITAQDSEIAELLYTRLDETYKCIIDNGGLTLKNRAICISTFFFINKLIEAGESNKFYFVKERRGV